MSGISGVNMILRKLFEIVYNKHIRQCFADWVWENGKKVQKNVLEYTFAD